MLGGGDMHGRETSLLRVLEEYSRSKCRYIRPQYYCVYVLSNNAQPSLLSSPRRRAPPWTSCTLVVVVHLRRDFWWTSAADTGDIDLQGKLQPTATTIAISTGHAPKRHAHAHAHAHGLNQLLRSSRCPINQSPMPPVRCQNSLGQVPRTPKLPFVPPVAVTVTHRAPCGLASWLPDFLASPGWTTALRTSSSSHGRKDQGILPVCPRLALLLPLAPAQHRSAGAGTPSPFSSPQAAVAGVCV